MTKNNSILVAPNVRQACLVVLALVAVLSSNSTHAGVVLQIDNTANTNVIDTPNSATPGGAGTAANPWLKLTISDKNDVGFATLATNQVEVDFKIAMGAGNFVTDVYFNIIASLLPSHLAAAFVSGSGAQASVSTGVDNGEVLNTNGHPGFDIQFSFPTSNHGRLGMDAGNGNSTTSSYILTYTGSSLSSGDFAALSDPGSYYLAAHFQGLAGGSVKLGENSTVNPNDLTPVPEPGSLVVWGLLGLVGIGFSLSQSGVISVAVAEDICSTAGMISCGFFAPML